MPDDINDSGIYSEAIPRILHDIHGDSVNGR